MNKERPRREYFTQAEAETKIGKRIRTRVAFSGVPEGTTGVVVSADPAGWGRPASGEKTEVYDAVIQWDLPSGADYAELVIPPGGEPYLFIQTGSPLKDWFTKDEYERYLDELPDEAEDGGTA